jgi:hypothetical protein
MGLERKQCYPRRSDGDAVYNRSNTVHRLVVSMPGGDPLAARVATLPVGDVYLLTQYNVEHQLSESYTGRVDRRPASHVLSSVRYRYTPRGSLACKVDVVQVLCKAKWAGIRL